MMIELAEKIEHAKRRGVALELCLLSMSFMSKHHKTRYHVSAPYCRTNGMSPRCIPSARTSSVHTFNDRSSVLFLVHTHFLC